MSSIKDLIGTQLGRYRIVEHLATGGMAEIFLARHEAEAGFQKQLVLKVLQRRWEDRPEVVDLFLGEARIAALMNHPNIVDVYDVASEDGKHFIAMEHIPGKTLTDLAKRAIQVTKSIPTEVGLFIAAEVAGALSHMYDGTGGDGQPFRVVHRDISPTNVLISTSGEVKLIDFGIARQGVAVIEESGARPGKVTYMSPEQVKGRPIDGRSDIFCLGTILYEITLGRRLWRGPREVAVKRIVEERPKPPTYVRRDYPAELEIIVMRALEKRPEDRYQSPTEFYYDLQSFMERSSAHLRNNFQMADYAAKIFSEEAEALISDVGRRRAQAFVEGNESAESDDEDLDFDLRQSDGPGAALARALRTSTLRLGSPLSTLDTAGEPAENPEGEAPTATSDADSRSESVGDQQESHGGDAANTASERVKSTLENDETGNGAPDTTVSDAPSEEAARSKAETSTEIGNAKIAARPSATHTKQKKVDDETSDRLPRRWNGVVVVGIVLVAALAVGALWLLHGG
jgi:serine/threonine protein kinase